MWNKRSFTGRDLVLCGLFLFLAGFLSNSLVHLDVNQIHFYKGELILEKATKKSDTRSERKLEIVTLESESTTPIRCVDEEAQPAMYWIIHKKQNRCLHSGVKNSLSIKVSTVALVWVSGYAPL